jgi:hypothetical protein
LLQEVRPHAVAQVVLDVEADPAAGQTSPHGDDEAYDGDAEEGETVGDEQPGLAADERVVDGQLDDARHQQAEAHLGERQRETHEREPLVVAEELENAPEGLHLDASLPRG